MQSNKYDLKFLQAGVDELESYLLSKNLYWPIHVAVPVGTPAYPRLTLGNLLLTFHCFQVETLQDYEVTQLRRLEQSVDHWRNDWKTAWTRKVKHEFGSRLRQWSHYINELKKEPEGNLVFYKTEVRLRVILELLKAEMDDLDGSQKDALGDLDFHLQSILVPGAFIWNKELSSEFCQKVYWYLWGEPKIYRLLPQLN